MQAYPITDIVVPDNRQRSSMDDKAIAELAESLEEVGQIQAITLRRNGDGKLVLMTGERRLRARRLRPGMTIRCGSLAVPEGHIAAVLWDELPEWQQYQIELDENIRRVDLSWQDRVRAIARLNTLRVAQERIRDKPYTKLDLAAEARLTGKAGLSPAAEANLMVTVAQHLDDPEVVKAPTLREAAKVVERKIRSAEYGKLAAAFEERARVETPHRLIRGDCFAEYPRLEPSSIDVLLTDPPYGVGADGFGSQAAVGHSYLDTSEVFERICWDLPKVADRLLRPSAHLYVFHDIRYFAELKAGFAAEGFDVWDTPLIWAKNGGMLPRPAHGPRRTYEAILFAMRGEKRVELIAPDVLVHPIVGDKEHGAQKPVNLYRDLLARSTRPGSRVIDPFCGSGTIFPAATACSCSAVGIEVDAAYADLAAKRMTEGVEKDLLATL